MSRPRFVPGPVMDFTSKIGAVISQFDCKRHHAPVGMPCFQLRMDTRENYLAGICSTRASKVYNGVAANSSQKEKK